MHIQSVIEELKECAKTDSLVLHSGACEASFRSLAEFIHRFLQGGVFEEDGLYAWHDEVMKG